MSQNFSFALVNEPWIPCVLPHGGVEERGILGTLEDAAGIIRVADRSPLVTASLHRLLLAVLHRVFGPEDETAWQGIWGNGRFDQEALKEYLEGKCAGRFDLFHPERPFYQVARFSGKVKEKENQACSLIQDLSKDTLFDHYHEDQDYPLTPAFAARTLVAYQAYHRGGIFRPPVSFTDCPTARHATFLVHGNNLFETLCLNLLEYGDDRPIMGPGKDLPAWEQEPVELTLEQPRGYLDFLTWQSRQVRLVPEREGDSFLVRNALLGLGRKLSSDGKDVDPLAAYLRNKKEGYRAVPFREGKALWRDSSAIFSLRTEQSKPPKTLEWLARLKDHGSLPEEAFYSLDAFGAATEPGQDKIHLWRQEHLPLPAAILDSEELLAMIPDAVDRAEIAANALNRAARTFASDLLAHGDMPADKKEVSRQVEHLGVLSVFWPRLDEAFHRLLANLPKNPEAALEGWTAHLVRTARDSFDQAMRDLDRSARTTKAMVHARGALNAGLAKIVELIGEEKAA
ncbi:MAG: type I-E CRISPR-associated protein Cse1/CasA [Deltaproteobacteria bacterium]|nr:type I-E CRISPR-associated protein Cse1/CasA [Deltaproteobacteria bacterium]